MEIFAQMWIDYWDVFWTENSPVTQSMALACVGIFVVFMGRIVTQFAFKRLRRPIR